MTAFSGCMLEEATADRSFWGRIVESTVGAHLHNTALTATRLYYWRDVRGRHAIPVEIKKNTYLRLWSAINDQLINQYARALESGGFGVYLVLWFGVRHTKIVPPTDRLPKTPEALQERLSAQLPHDKRHKIKVVVVDVSDPSSWT